MESILRIFSDEVYFRIQVDKYTGFIGMMSAFACHALLDECALTERCTSLSHCYQSILYTGTKLLVGVLLMLVWFVWYGAITDKAQYNPLHAYVFWMPILGYWCVRSACDCVSQYRSSVLRFLGRHALEIYVMQFHVFMSHNAQQIPIIFPGADKDGSLTARYLNMICCGTLMVALAYWARCITRTTQTVVADVVTLVERRLKTSCGQWPSTRSPPRTTMMLYDQVVQQVNDSGGGNLVGSGDSASSGGIATVPVNAVDRPLEATEKGPFPQDTPLIEPLLG